MRPLGVLAACVACLPLPLAASAADRADKVLACFEAKDYGGWKATGEAFGPGPAQGALPDQMPVSGYKGHGPANSFFHGDASVGTLTSPEFHINFPYLNFLIGGGNHPDKTCLNLLVDGKVVRTATGRDSEQLLWRTFDLTALHGKAASIQIVDDETGGWGHILVDQIVLSDRKEEVGPAGREIAVESRYLNLPVKRGAAKRRMRYVLDDTTVREFEIELADGEPSFWVFDDISEWKGKKLRVEVDGVAADFKGLAAVEQGDAIKGGDDPYKEKHRPRFHFTSRRGWLNDPNGLVYSDGEYHLFYQHNPYGWDWGNMTWGHAVSPDLVHWKELSPALYPRRFGDWCFSGSAVVDKDNASGFGSAGPRPLVAAYTSTGRGECIAYSNDRGRTFTDYKNDPVVKHTGRDPRLLWYAPGKHWVMAVYDESGGKRGVAFYTSPDLKEWKYQSRIEGFFECPDLFELPVEGGDGAKKWVLYSGDARYLLGDFDGKAFAPDAPDKQQLWYGNFYAAQTYNNAPDGRRVQIGWGNGIAFPDMPFNQQMAFPCRLTLRKTAEGVRMFAEPVQEIDTLHTKKHAVADRTLKPGDNPLAGVTGDLFDLRAEFEPGDGEAFGFTVRGVPVVYDVKKQEISCKGVTAPLKPEGGKVRLQLLVDCGSIEIFGNGGRVALSVGVIPADDNHSLDVFSRGGATRLRSLEAFEMKSAWEAAASADQKPEGVACRSVHLRYPAPEAVAFYNEVAVDASARGSYFMVCGFGDGYFGMQELADGKKVLLFSVWDASDKNDPNAVGEEKRVKVLQKDEKVRVGRFGGEGTGAQSFFDYDWKVGATYRFLVTAKVEDGRTAYAAYFYVPEDKDWKRLATLSTITGGKGLHGYYSFIEDFRRNRVSAGEARTAHFGNGWVKAKDGQWTALTRARFTADSNPVKNVNADVDGDRFLLATGGDTKNSGAALGDQLDRRPEGVALPADMDHPASKLDPFTPKGSGK